MPNWAEGLIKIRGTRQDIRKFLTQGLKPTNYSYSSQQFEVEIEEDEFELTMKALHGFYIKNTRRSFIDGEINWWFDDVELEVLTIESFKQAWVVEASQFSEISKEFNLDIKIYAFESGMEFNQNIEIHKGEIIKNEVIRFDDYKWECLYPDLGG
ncbi:MAG TPA: hypothetical protein K8V56_16095 [Sporosarcina psychrophila]|uniref:YubB ferredoxin-like domain-containing protein n=1 Tax=Sporosarcina psychrophila TaxID=1476 RepID=A0A921KFL0_SPOPS|nr:hypothetical protein [Sporosarcina psychrophila]